MPLGGRGCGFCSVFHRLLIPRLPGIKISPGLSGPVVLSSANRNEEKTTGTKMAIAGEQHTLDIPSPPRRKSARSEQVYRKEMFLSRQRSPAGRIPYKRYLGAPIRYAGGKSLATGIIIEQIPGDIRRLVSPFIGGGSIEVACAVEIGIPTVGYDVFDVLTTYWKAQLRHPAALYERLSRFEATPEEFRRAKETLRQHWKKERRDLHWLDVAALYYFTHNTSYGPGFLSWPSYIYMNQDRYEKMIKKVAQFAAPNLTVEQASFETVLPKHRNDFLYCDPPYYLGRDTKMFRGIYPQRNFPIHHNGFDHALLKDLLNRHKGGFLLSYNDCPQIREWYADYEISTPSWQYTLGQGETRIGKYRPDGNHVKQSHELLIYAPPAA